ncbi:thioester dehydrase [Hypericibacter terrae]|jgi:predicted hotdog family 3-hydroxylacyl-ACP dehydratase|uniref:Thioester dehydrase n=1 Tax=Hypericibacter terrae TaxID=2602015 RepID=A0A5J6MG93_9PROT|nr:3-hydroxylacyl-ACP dehydratase [Hypericibacter terrae]QEX16498.1 thioester dehydrase [Hypericibacter terrae]
MQPCSYATVDLLPHKPPMVLIDAVRAWGEGRLEATVAVRPGISFFVPEQGVPAYVGMEYMAQACGAYAGLQAMAAGEPVRVGLLLGTRRYLAQVGWFEPGQALDIKIVELFRDGSIGMFDCRIEHEGRTLATAQLSVYLLEPGAPLPGPAADE